MSTYEQRLADAEHDFKRFTAKHILEVCDEGAGMRRLVVRAPDTWSYGFVITTWPGYLAIAGDIGSFVFARVPDMFQFFRSEKGTINPDYWSEKVVAQDKNGVQEFSLATLCESIQVDLDESDNEDLDERYAKMLDRLKDFSDAASEEHDVVEAMMEFESDAYDRRRHLFTRQFLNCCHAIVLAIRLYDERNAKGPCKGCRSCQVKAPGPGGVRACPRCDHELCPNPVGDAQS